MDAYERMVQLIWSKQGEERDREMERLDGQCICPDCPSYNKCAEERKELLYCFRGKSPRCIKDELGCTCPQCPVAADAELVNLYYCTSGSEKMMRER